MRRLLLLALLLAGLAAGAVAVSRALPSWYVDHVPPWVARRVYPLDHAAAIASAAARSDLDPALVAGLIYEESGYRADAVSHTGAVGLMQVLPSTGREIARETGASSFTAADLADPGVNIRYGSRYLRTLLDHYGGSRLAAVAAYNAGARNVDAWLAAARRQGHRFGPGDIGFGEAREYVTEVARLTESYRRAYGPQLAAG